MVRNKRIRGEGGVQTHALLLVQAAQEGTGIAANSPLRVVGQISNLSRPQLVRLHTPASAHSIIISRPPSQSGPHPSPTPTPDLPIQGIQGGRRRGQRYVDEQAGEPAVGFGRVRVVKER